MTEPPPARASLATLRRLAPYVHPHRWPLLAGGAAALAGTLAGLTVPLVTRAIVDGPIARGELGALPWLVLGVLGLGVGEAVLLFLRRRLVAGPSTGVEAAMRADLFAHLQRLPVSFHDAGRPGSCSPAPPPTSARSAGSSPSPASSSWSTSSPCWSASPC